MPLHGGSERQARCPEKGSPLSHRGEMDRIHSSQRSFALLFVNLSELFATPSRLTVHQGPICNRRRAVAIGSRPMDNLSNISGYVASALVLLTFIAKDMRLLRTAAIFSNLAFITYGTLQWLPPVLVLHLLLLPLNMVRLSEVLKSDKIAGKPIAFAATLASFSMNLVHYPQSPDLKTLLSRHHEDHGRTAPC
jgi:hypothetical protein